jgi:hypothetical protein
MHNFLLAFLLVWGAQPKVALYGNNNSGGWPFIKNDNTLDSLIIKRTARHSLISIPVDPSGTNRSDIVATLRYYNPNAKIVFYTLVCYHWVTPPNGSYLDNNMQFNAQRWRIIRDNNGWIYGTDGKVWADNFNINMASRGCAQGMANLVRSYTRTHISDGWFFDDLHNSSWWQTSNTIALDYERAGFHSLAAFDSAYKHNVQEFIDSVRVECNGLVFANGADGCHGLDGTMREGIDAGPGLATAQQAMAFAETTSLAHPWIKDENFLPYGSTAELKNERVNLAIATMGHGWSFFGPNNDGYFQPYFGTWWFDEYAVRPYPYTYTDTTGTCIGWLGNGGDKIAVAPNAWLRWFDNGCVMLNLSDSPVTFNTTVTFKRIQGKLDPYINNGQESQRFIVPAHDALFVVRKPRPKPINK